MPTKWRSKLESERWRREKRKAEMIAATQRQGTATAEDIAWLQAWKRRQKWEQRDRDPLGAQPQIGSVG
jgi:hypothetical protein